MRKCCYCKEDKEIEEFNFKVKSKGTRRSYCKVCERSKKRRLYQTRKKEHQARNKKAITLLKIEVNDIKSLSGCLVCKETEASCLDFHHLDPSIKEWGIARAISNGQRKKALEEIKKCVVLCSNCHRKYHAGKITLNANMERE